MNNEDHVQRLHDQYLLRQLRYKYSYYYDNRLWDEWLTLFTDDIVYDASSVDYEVFRGKEEFRRFVEEHAKNARPYEAHHALHPRITVHGDRAEGQWVLHEMSVDLENTLWWLQGEYIDTYRRVNGSWKFSEVKVVIEATAEFPDANIDIRTSTDA